MRAPLQLTTLISEEIRKFVTKGTICKMYFFIPYITKRYKDDGTRSYLRLYFNRTLTEVYCRRDDTNYIKPKWKLSIAKIAELRDNYRLNPR
jgi:hypothetical protein